MSITLVRRAGLVCLALAAITLWVVSSTRVSASSAGDKPGHHHHDDDDDDQQGATSSFGPPFVWACTPAYFPLSGSNTPADVLVFNGSATTANVAVHIYDKDGNNLAGVTIPGTSPAATYPGQTGTSTVPVLSKNTLVVSFQTPQDSPPGGPNVSATVEVVSDQPIAVGSDFQFSGFHNGPCSPVFK